MKTVRIILMLTAVAASLSFSACSSGTQNSSHSSEHSEAASPTYHCPMKCEGEKTYAEEGKCPVCTMDLVAVED